MNVVEAVMSGGNGHDGIAIPRSLGWYRSEKHPMKSATYGPDGG
jgi:hypothetical protein